MVPLLNRPFLAYQIALLRQHGVRDIILSCSYRVEDVRRALGDARDLGVSLRYVVEDEPLGTGGGVRNAVDLAQGTIFVLNGDVLTDADLTAMRAFHESRGSRVTIFLTPVPDPRAYGLVETARGRAAAPVSREARAGRGDHHEHDQRRGLPHRRRAPRPHSHGRMVSIEREFFPAVIADGIPSFGWSAPAYWRDIGNPAAYHAAQIDLLGGRVKTSLVPAGESRRGSWVHPTAATAAARIEPPSVVGADVRLAPGAEVGPYAVIGPGSIIGAGARVQRAVLWERVRVGDGAVLRDCVVGADATIGARAEVGDGVVLESGAVVPAGEVRRGARRPGARASRTAPAAPVARPSPRPRRPPPPC